MQLIHIHIFLSTLAFVVLCIAAVQAFLLAIQEWLLRHKQSNRLLNLLPPLQAMETFLFKAIVLGFVLLTAVLLTSLFSFGSWMPLLWQKILLSLFAWLVFMGLLLGRYYFGWRGRVAIRWTLLGVGLVVLVYLGTLGYINATI